MLDRQLERPAVRRDRSALVVELVVLPPVHDGCRELTGFLRDVAEQHRTRELLREAQAALLVRAACARRRRPCSSGRTPSCESASVGSAVWGDHSGTGQERVKFAVLRLRHKVGWDDPATSPLRSVHGIGCRLDPPA
ncbi:MAG TPA: helix-turn-helix domain-containing protein [Nocardioides sp.]|nr:helix-turn-helix domain-containing protein [Nocardioides sp.]